MCVSNMILKSLFEENINFQDLSKRNLSLRQLNVFVMAVYAMDKVCRKQRSLNRTRNLSSDTSNGFVNRKQFCMVLILVPGIYIII